MAQLGFLDKFLLRLAPHAALDRIRARHQAEVMLRHFEGAAHGRRTSGHHRPHTDANAANLPALALLRNTVRDLERNNPWSKKAIRVIANDTVGWGIVPKPGSGSDRAKKKAKEAWKAWAESTQCDADGRTNLYGLQRRVMRSVVRDGEVLIRRRRRRPGDGLAIPLQLQLLEADFLDTRKDGIKGYAGGPIIQGVEFDALGRRAAYWLFSEHPGSRRVNSTVSTRVPAEDIAHIYLLDREGQVRGVTWGAAVVLRTKDGDEYEDATLLKQKVAACFAGVVTDVDGKSTGIGQQDAADERLESIEPGMMAYLPPGKSVTFADPPTVSEFDPFSKNILRGIAAGWGITYEAMTGDYSQVNFSSARMARLGYQQNLHEWRWDMLIPQFCDRAWAWAMEAAYIAGTVSEVVTAQWTPPPMPMIEPDKEGLAYSRNVRAGLLTPDEMVREQGYDPDEHWREYGANIKRIRGLGIVLDSDAGMTTQAGNPRQQSGGQQQAGETSSDGAATNE